MFDCIVFATALALATVMVAICYRGRTCGSMRNKTAAILPLTNEKPSVVPTSQHAPTTSGHSDAATNDTTSNNCYTPSAPWNMTHVGHVVSNPHYAVPAPALTYVPPPAPKWTTMRLPEEDDKDYRFPVPTVLPADGAALGLMFDGAVVSLEAPVAPTTPMVPPTPPNSLVTTVLAQVFTAALVALQSIVAPASAGSSSGLDVQKHNKVGPRYDASASSGGVGSA
ncbi:hypothetical protein EXIGLDRAFT_171096 [Exidia glandulosa HHB12029]|uniref:Uncharacterized protein n=1 Tax=Exidia glandulosa HHB12029 TaxID=1314781 RepID=A0A165FB05_EXIGL|nr:hypothetical protein EXIGLDRAFT_171096 [Exidia glandulosa HHB12029]